MKRLSFITAALLLLTGAVQAKDWQVDATHSSLTFSGDQNGEKFTGGFKKFVAQILFDPDNPGAGKITVSVDTSSAYAGSPDRDEMLPEREWFDVSHFPQAQFATTVIRKVAAGHYAADATLTIKGIVHNVTLPFTLVPEGDHWRAQGHVGLMRNDFAVGSGSYDNESYVKHLVDVGIDIVAR